jgi:uncharacterized protein YcfJ
MKTRTSAAIALGLALAAGAASAHGVRYTTARVTAVEPVYETVIVERPYRHCHTEVVERHVRSGSVAGQTLAGAIVGAAIGRQFGGGSGRDALTAIGAVAGSAVANERALRRQGVTVVRQPVERCTTEYRREARRQITGYWVDYRYRGRNYRILSHEHPGRQIRISVRS